MVKAAWVSLLSKDEYLAGLLVVEYGLRSVKSQYPLIVMVTESVPELTRDILRKRGLKLVEVSRLAPTAGREKFGEFDARFGETWSKVRTWEMTDYDRVVLLDADMVVKRNMDELMDIELQEGHIAAAHVCACNPRKLAHYPADWIPENCGHTAVKTPTSPPPSWTEGAPRPYGQFNSGLVVLNPSDDTARAIVERLATSDQVENFTFGDQDLLIEHFFGKWKALPWYYNALRTLKVVHEPLWSNDEVRCIHYILGDKPWMSRVPPEGTGSPYDDVNRWWWEHYHAVEQELLKSDPVGRDFVDSTVAH
ncbi:glycosyltransferase family 8 protein [Cylindrobasidium torrendii FP15055 ss-10]|uniref:Glycosyltransferase family 8 protein n=1 Tax=Cylindrobasidium torrendii FP15055 ss-10 TaxID=1314674 RepID=A0A0D7BRQ2_9AGAR|nr:glycosyltransferase family 8 protein [Cylindrobasidium torrendii FP15055 ss-10]